MPVINVDESNFEREVLGSDEKVLVDFYADWCGPCKMMGPIVDQISNESKNEAKIAKINVDENKSIATKYNVMTIPTFIVFEGGEKQNSLVGVQSKEALTDLLK